MRFRKLRIAWSVVWGVICVLLIVLWVRSYLRLDMFSYQDQRLSSHRGYIVINGVFDFDNPVDYFKSQSLKLFGGKISLQSFTGEIAWDHSAVAIPDWDVVAPVILLSVMSWIRWSKRFSLRTLLIATTLVALVLGAIMWTIRNGP